MTTVGRNEPCPCGSGKKYKKCCMLKDTAVDLKEFREARAEETLRGEILRFAMGERFKDEIIEAFGIYNANKVPMDLMMSQGNLENIRFLDWFIHEHKHLTEDKRIIDLFAEVRGKALDDDQKKLLEEWQASRVGAFEVESVTDDVLKLADIFGDEKYTIEDPSACEEVEDGMVVVARVTSSWGKGKLAGAPILLSADSKEKLLESIDSEFEEYKKDHPDDDRAKFLSDNVHRLISIAADLA